MNLIKSLGLALALVGALASSAKAVSLTGIIIMGGGTVTLDNTNLVSATAVTSWSGATVGGVTGTLASFTSTGTAINFSTPWSFVSGAKTPLYTTGTLTFNLVSSSINTQNATGIIVNGIGSFVASGYEETTGTFTFTSQEPDLGGGVFSWSASGATVPDGGSSALFLGLGLLGLGIAARRSKSV